MEIKETNRVVGNYGEFLQYADVFCETGSCYGRSIQLALDAGYTAVISVEAKEEYHEHCKKLFLGKNVSLYLGKSIDRLKEMLEFADVDCVIFLDAHVSGEASAGYQDWVEKQEESDYDQHRCLMAELDIIKNTSINGKEKGHVIIIDDQNGWNDNTLEYVTTLYKINPDYKLFWYDEQMGDNFYKNKMLVAIP